MVGFFKNVSSVLEFLKVRRFNMNQIRKFCSKCGKKTEEKEDNCLKCGSKIERNEAEEFLSKKAIEEFNERPFVKKHNDSD